MNKDLDIAIEILKKNNQEHIIPFLENGLNSELINEILNTNFDELKELYSKTSNKNTEKLDNLAPILAFNPNKLSEEEDLKTKNIGIEIIKNNKFAVVTMAGGQGTRLRAYWT